MNSILLLSEANLTPRNFARFGHAGRQRLSGAPLSRDVAPRELRATAPSAADCSRVCAPSSNAAPSKRKSLAHNVTMLSGPGGSV